MTKKVHVNLTVSADADLTQVATAASAIGLSIEQQLDELGVISGEIDESRLDALRSLPHVLELELGRAVELPPTGSPIQ